MTLQSTELSRLLVTFVKTLYALSLSLSAQLVYVLIILCLLLQKPEAIPESLASSILTAIISGMALTGELRRVAGVALLNSLRFIRANFENEVWHVVAATSFGWYARY
jgi:hypothetical protein